MATVQNENMIEVENVSMRFNLGIEKGFSLKQWFVDIGHGKKHEKKQESIGIPCCIASDGCLPVYHWLSDHQSQCRYHYNDGQNSGR